VANLEHSGQASNCTPPNTVTEVPSRPTKSPRSGRRRRGTRRDQQSGGRVTAVTGPTVQDVVMSVQDQRPYVPSSLPVHSTPMLNPPGFIPPFSSAPQPSHAAAGVRAGLLVAPITSVTGNRVPNVRFVNGDDGSAWFAKHVAPGSGGTPRLPRGRQDSSSSTDSAETVRHLEHGTCVGDVDRYLTAGAVMQSAAGSASVKKTFATPSALSSAQGMRFYFRPALLSGVSFPASRSELEQYKQVVHGSAYIPPTETTAASTPKSQSPRVRQRSPGRGRGRRAAASAGDAPRSAVVPATVTSSVPRFYSLNMAPSSLSMPPVRGLTQPSVSAVYGTLRLFVCVCMCNVQLVSVKQIFKFLSPSLSELI